jgi:hypothetical protein
MHLMNMKRHVLICFFIYRLANREKEWDSYKMEVVIKRWEIVINKINKKNVIFLKMK